MARSSSQKPVPLWREDRQDPLAFPERTSYRVKTILIVLLFMLALAGILIGMFFWIRPRPNPLFVPLWITHYSAPQIPPIPHAEADRDALGKKQFFGNEDAQAYDKQNGYDLLQTLKALKNVSSPVLIHLAARALRAGDGEIYLLPADADPDNPSTWLKFKDVLQLIKNCPSSYKLLIVDIAHPYTSARLGMLKNDVAGAIPEEIAAANDARLLVLSACSPGQVSLASEALGRSVFSYYLEQGLRGWADGFLGMNKKDGRVSVKELAAFVKVRVDRWAKQNRNTRQTPLLLGNGSDFNLHAPTDSQREEAPSLPESPKYPKWLSDAWKIQQTSWESNAYRLTPYLFRYQSALLLRAEQNWRGGMTADRIQSGELARFQQVQASLPKKSNFPQPQPMSLFQVTQGKVDGNLAKELNNLLVRLDKTTRNLKKEPADKVRTKLLAEFVKNVKKQPYEAVAQAVLASAAARQQLAQQRLRLLESILQAVSLEPPQYAETLLLRQLAALQPADANAWLAKVVARMLQTKIKASRAKHSLRAYAWNKVLLEEAAQLRHDGALRFWAQGYASIEEAGALLQTASKRYDIILGNMTTIEEASATLDEAVLFLPFYRPYLRLHPDKQQLWLDAVETARDLYQYLLAPKSEPLQASTRIKEIRRQTTALQGALQTLQQPFRAEVVQQLVETSKLPRTGAAVWREINAVLKTPFLPAKSRQKLWLAALDLEKRLHEATAEIDQEDNVAGSMETQLPPYKPQKFVQQNRQVGIRLAKEMLALFRMAGLDDVKLVMLQEALDKASADNASVKTWCKLSTMLRQTWAEGFRKQYLSDPSLTYRDRLLHLYPPLDGPPQLDAGQPSAAVLALRQQALPLWSWLADRHRYAARDFRGSGLSGDAVQALADFHARALSVYAAFSPPPPESYVQITGGSRIPRLTSQRPSAKSAVQLQLFQGQTGKTGEAVKLQMLLSDKRWLQVEPSTIELKSLAAKEGVSIVRTATVPFQVKLKTSAETLRNPPRGFLVEALRGHRSYHRSVEVPLRKSDDLQIIFSPNPKVPDPSLESIRLRPGQVKQVFFVYVYNAGIKPQTVVGQVWYKGKVLSSAESKVTVAPQQSVKIPLGPGATAKGKPPVLDGPLEVCLVDPKDKGSVLSRRTVQIAIARPREYVTVSDVIYEPATQRNQGKNKLSVTLENVASVTGPPIRAELALPLARIPALISVKNGTFMGILPAQFKKIPHKLNLFAQEIKLAPAAERDGIVYVHVDGYQRCFIFRTTFAHSGDPLTPHGDLRPAVRFKVAEFVPASPQFAIPVEVDNAPDKAKLEVSLGRFVGETFQADITEKHPTAKKQEVHFQLDGTSGGLVLTASVEDWNIMLDTSKILGPRHLQARLLDEGGSEIVRTVQKLTVDSSAPRGVRFLEVPEKAKKASKIRVKAIGNDSETGVAAVSFFVGSPEKGKAPVKAEPVAAKPIDKERTTWVGEVPLPDQTGPIALTVQMKNRAGMLSFDTAKIILTTKDPALSLPATIKGKVMLGTLEQPGLDVFLIDAKGKIAGKVKTNNSGQFLFENVKPGRYRIYSRQRASTRQGYRDVTVKPGQTVDEEIGLSLTPGR